MAVLSAVVEVLDGWLPTVRQLLVAGPLFLASVAAAGHVAGRLRVRRGVRTPYTRKVFHFLIFTGAGAVHYVGGRPLVVLYGAVVALWVLQAVAHGDGDPFYEALARASDAPRRSTFVLVPLATTAAGGVLANLLFPTGAVIGYLVCGWGDAMGEPVGARWGRHRYRVPSFAGVTAERSLEGSAAVLVAGALAAAAGGLLLGAAPERALVLGMACGVVGAAVEAVSTHGADNLTVQVAAAAAWSWLA